LKKHPERPDKTQRNSGLNWLKIFGGDELKGGWISAQRQNTGNIKGGTVVSVRVIQLKHQGERTLFFL
jgi:hypothetical protein